ncbi:acyl-CoA synthetase [Gandjariella thermophila]|uniref:acyl-CoA synthetase n=1 Tax=Gandjariella thermophila TaxID=1931992 RepID=UPI0035306646
MPEPQAQSRPAIQFGDVRLSREALWGAATAVADEVAGAGMVALHATASPATVVGMVGCLIAGVPVVPVPADAGSHERHHVLTDSGARLWLGEPVDAVDLPVVPIDLGGRSSASHPEPDPDSTALVMYTSGTTGAPKGAVHSRRALAAGLDGLADAWRWTPEDVLVHGLPLFHVHGLILGVLGALRVGSPLIHTVRPRPENYAAAAAAGGTLFFGVPTIWSRIGQDAASAEALRGARLLVSGSAPLPVPDAERLRALTGQAPVERYGMTETLITVAMRAEGERRVGWVGTPIAGVETCLRGERGEPVPADGQSVGELHVRGATLFQGYLGRPEATAECFTGDGWFRTGDAAVVDADGWHRIVGRQSVDIIKTGGYKVGAGEVEAALLSYPGVAEAAVVGAPDADLGQRIVAYLVGDPGLDPAAVIDFVASQLSAHKRPREVRIVESLPRNAMGKVQKKALASGTA